MSKNRKKQVEPAEPEMWIRPNLNLKGQAGNRAWNDSAGGIPNSARYLELADIALGAVKPKSKKRQPDNGVRSSKKTEPYLSEHPLLAAKSRHG